MLSIQTFRLAHLIQTEEEQDKLRTFRKLQGFFFQRKVLSPMTEEALGQAYHFNLRILCVQFCTDFQLCGIYHGGACSLISWGKGKVSDNGYLSSFFQRKGMFFIL